VTVSDQQHDCPQCNDEADPVCPDCQDQRHWNCDSGAWDEWLDEPTYCRCWKNGHE
jgi:hypothetical protein